MGGEVAGWGFRERIYPTEGIAGMSELAVRVDGPCYA